MVNTTCPLVRFDYDYFSWDRESDSGIINFTREPERYGIRNPLHRWQYTVFPDGVDTCVDVWDAAAVFGEAQFEAYLSLILTSVSIFGLIVTLVTYAAFEELRNLPGLNLMALSTCILTYQVTFLSTNNARVIANRTACKVSAILIHFSILASFFWTSVMAWDIYKTFGRKTIISRCSLFHFFLFFV